MCFFCLDPDTKQIIPIRIQEKNIRIREVLTHVRRVILNNRKLYCCVIGGVYVGGVEEEEAWWALGAAGAAVPREEAGHLLPVWAWILLTSLSLLILLALGKDRHSTFDITTH